MNISGRFRTASSVDALVELGSRPATLEHVSTLDDVVVDSAGAIRARFAPETALGRFVFRVRITTGAWDARGARLRVVGQHGNSLVDVDLALVLNPSDDGMTAVTWDANLTVRGMAASVGQRVARDVTQRAVGEVLVEAAEVARQRV